MSAVEHKRPGHCTRDGEIRFSERSRGDVGAQLPSRALRCQSRVPAGELRTCSEPGLDLVRGACMLRRRRGLGCGDQVPRRRRLLVRAGRQGCVQLQSLVDESGPVSFVHPVQPVRPGLEVLASRNTGHDTAASHDSIGCRHGAPGSTRRKLAAAAGCIIEYVGRLACMAGYR